MVSDRSFDEVLLWALAQHGDVTVEMVRDRWGRDRATCFRWRNRCNDFRQKFMQMQRSRRPLEVCGRSSVIVDDASTTADPSMPGFYGVPMR